MQAVKAMIASLSRSAGVSGHSSLPISLTAVLPSDLACAGLDPEERDDLPPDADGEDAVENDQRGVLMLPFEQTSRDHRVGQQRQGECAEEQRPSEERLPPGEGQVEQDEQGLPESGGA